MGGEKMTVDPYDHDTEENDWTCSNCDTPNWWRYSFCTNCGNQKPLDEEEVYYSNDPDDI